MRGSLILLAVPVLLGACGYVSEYEKGVYDYEAVYCYKSLGGIQCFKTPNHRDERRLVNYYGPAPSRYDRPEPPPPLLLSAPPKVDYFVRDPDPIPEPAPRPERTPLPWHLGNPKPEAPAAPEGEAEAPETGPDAPEAAPLPPVAGQALSPFSWEGAGEI